MYLYYTELKTKQIDLHVADNVLINKNQDKNIVFDYHVKRRLIAHRHKT